MAFPPRQVVTITQDDHPALATHLEQALREERESQVQALISAKDWPDFEKRRGLIHGIDAAISLCQRTSSKLNA